MIAEIGMVGAGAGAVASAIGVAGARAVATVVATEAGKVRSAEMVWVTERMALVGERSGEIEEAGAEAGVGESVSEVGGGI